MGHTPECVEARGGEGCWPMMYQLSLEAQQAVLDCWDLSHLSVFHLFSGKPWKAPWLEVVE